MVAQAGVTAQTRFPCAELWDSMCLGAQRKTPSSFEIVLWLQSQNRSLCTSSWITRHASFRSVSQPQVSSPCATEGLCRNAYWLAPAGRELASDHSHYDRQEVQNPQLSTKYSTFWILNPQGIAVKCLVQYNVASQGHTWIHPGW